MRKINYRGKEYLRKQLIEIAFMPKKCAFKKNKQTVVYENGIAVVRMLAGICQRYSTDDVKDIFHILFYDMDGEEDEIIFEDQNLQKEWRTLFVYMFGEDGAFLLYADRSTLNITGVRARVGSEELIPGIRQEAFNAAALLLEKLPEVLLSMEEVAEQRDSELTLLDVGQEYGR